MFSDNGGPSDRDRLHEAYKEIRRLQEALAAAQAPPASDPPGLVEAVKRALPALMANRPPNGQVAYSQVREAIDLIRAAYDALPASPQAKED